MGWVVAEKEDLEKVATRAYCILVDRGRMHMNDLANLLRCSAGRAYYACKQDIQIDIIGADNVQMTDRHHDCYAEINS